MFKYLNKGISTPIAIIIILIFTIIFGVIDYWEYAQIQKIRYEIIEIKIPEKKDETADRKTYRNEEYGFEIKYPKDWSYAKDAVRSSVDSPSMVFCSPDYYDPKEGCKLERVQYVTTNLAEIRLFIGKWSDLPAYLGKTKEEKKKGEMNCNTEIRLKTINGINVEICSQFNGDFSALWEDSTGSYLYHLHGFYDQDPEIFNQMLSTFKFEKIDKVETWKTYRNDKYGYEIKYPKDFSLDYQDQEKTQPRFGVFSIYVKPTTYSDISEWFEEWSKITDSPYMYEGTEFYPEIASVEDVMIQGEKAKKFRIDDFPYRDTTVAFIKNNHLYEIIYNGHHSKGEWEVYLKDLKGEKYVSKYREIQNEYREIFNQMVSTFRFLD